MLYRSPSADAHSSPIVLSNLTQSVLTIFLKINSLVTSPQLLGKEPELVQEEPYPLDIAGLYLVGRPTSSIARILDSWGRAGVAHSERHQASVGILTSPPLSIRIMLSERVASV